MPLRDDERYTEEEAYQRRIDTGEWRPNVMTEDERLEQRRMEAGSAFEMGTPVYKRSRLDHFGYGLMEGT